MKKYLILAIVIAGLGISSVAYQYAKADIFGSSLIGWYTLDSSDISGTTVTDKSGSGHTGTAAVTPVPINGKLGQAVQFLQVSGYHVDLGTGIVPTTALTLSAWAYATSSPGGHQYIIGRGDGSGSCGTPFEAYSISMSYDTLAGQTAGSSYPEFSVSTASTRTQAWSTVAVIVNVWYLITGTYDGTNMKLYVNGKLIQTQTKTGTVDNPSFHTFIADQGGGCSSPFGGGIDDVRVYNRALSQAEVQTLYYQGISSHQNGDY